jgi:OFA family oxalate/formate antiporter-like MFS transporter
MGVAVLSSSFQKGVGMDLTKKRHLMFVQLFLSVFTTGITYAWSVIALGIHEYHGWAMTDITLGYSLMALCLVIFGIVSGFVLDRFGPRYILLFAALLWGGGWMVMGFVKSIWQFWVSGAIIGIGDGLLYNTAITTAGRWYPERRGFVTGIMVGAAGLGPLFFSPLISYLVGSIGVNTTLKIIGAVFVAIIGSGFFITTSPPEGWFEKMMPAKGEQAATTPVSSRREYPAKEMLKTGTFYLLWFAFFCGCNAGLLLISNGTQIGVDIAKVSTSLAATFVGILAVFNFIGRAAIGSLGDKIGRIRSLYGIYAVMAVVLLFFNQAKTPILYLIATGLIGVCFGGLMANFPVLTGEAFGTKNQGANYGIMFTAYGIAAFTGPMAGAWFKENRGSWQGAFIFAAILAAISIALVYFVQRNLAKAKTA